MTEFTISIAGIPIRIQALHESTRDFCADFLTDEPPEFIVISSPEIIRREQERSDRQAETEGKTPVQYGDPYLEEIGIYREIAEQLLDRNNLLFHGSAIAVDGEVYLFTAKSGAGKSTHAKRWREMLGDRAVMVNDDKPILKITPEECFVCGTPWNGKHRLGSNVVLPLKAVCVLEQAEKNSIQRMDAWELLPVLMQQSYHPLDPAKNGKVMELISILTENVAFYKMQCNNMEDDAAKVSYEMMSKVNNGGNSGAED